MKVNELSCKDLMIGDWVMIIPIYYYQVEQIRMEFGELRIYLKGTEVFATENEIMPVPLTPEILENNGFEDWDGWSIYSPENTGIEIAWLGTILKIGGKCGNFELPVIEYVHQLQHALRLCGIEKEIEL
jgi:hypothetical protein